jgi:anti-sigma-K factor RskA
MTPDDQINAAELGLGVLEGADRAAALERMLAEPAFAAEVAWWRERFATLLADYPDAAAPADLLDKISLPTPAAATVTPLRRWPLLGAGALGGALAASLAALMLIPTPQPAPVAPPPAQPLVAVLVPSEGTSHLPVAALVDPDSRTVRFTATFVVPAGRAAELWRIGGDKVPRPIGLLARGSRTPVLLKGVVLPGPDETLAISIEPEGGSPTGKPTGPVIAAGAVVTT